MAVREATKTTFRVDTCIRLLKTQSSREMICQLQGSKTVKCFSTALLTRPCLRPSILCVNENDFTSSSSGEEAAAATFSSSTRSRSSLTVTSAKPFAVTNILSHLFAGDLHINSSCIYNNACFGFQPQRSVSRMTMKTSSPTRYYDVLGLNPNATQHQIKSAYYQMSKLHHPDVTACTKSHALFTEINEAYETLGNLRKRRLYDKGLFQPGARTDVTAETTGNDNENDYTETYRKWSAFERGNRPPPPRGRSKIYNFDEFYRQHYGDLRERRWKENIEYMKFKEEMDASRKANEQNVPRSILLGFFSAFVMILWIVLITSDNYDVNRLSKMRTKSSAQSNGDR